MKKNLTPGSIGGTREIERHNSGREKAESGVGGKIICKARRAFVG